MFDIKINSDKIQITSIEKEDLGNIYRWITCQVEPINNNLDFINEAEFYERFIEYYLNECEFFLKIEIHNELTGILKGRAEFKNPNEVWINYVFFSQKYRNLGLGSIILKEIIEYFTKDFGIINFFVKIEEDNFNTFDFWKKNKFIILEFLVEKGKKRKAIMKKIGNV
ncbi:acetyltransferase (GNAT) family protein [Clostridium homopropionicum DSM 5847]|uniref:Acetyltransferase (GNAT) family protein n=1 Tax=Clostridium homopropionicum DSM 5847 TaxID=1121318 RepID=A0A0L6ZB13_9CLOT|nr:GNAT family N-acetyltransferase [Clostridium homopropionicum]KOA20164.1 acetyltransferase (GNAT) family protein [Clostridium homopropionicum DSM 5847]SFG60719.1 Ribosomal protein S18 acetylase RimI [Clostridium homopropionicum]